jgi:hypothetical protein
MGCCGFAVPIPRPPRGEFAVGALSPPLAASFWRMPATASTTCVAAGVVVVLHVREGLLGAELADLAVGKDPLESVPDLDPDLAMPGRTGNEEDEQAVVAPGAVAEAPFLEQVVPVLLARRVPHHVLGDRRDRHLRDACVVELRGDLLDVRLRSSVEHVRGVDHVVGVSRVRRCGYQ